MATATAVKIGMIVFDSINMLDHYLALDAGIYQEEGLDVELVQDPPRGGGPSPLDTGEALVTSSTPRVIEAILYHQAPYKFVLITRRDPPHPILARPEIKTVADLKGKTVWGAPEGSTTYYMLLDWLRKNGLEPGVDVQVNTLSKEQASFFAGTIPAWVRPLMTMTIDAIAAPPPEGEWLKQKVGYNWLVDLTEEYSGRMVHGLIAHENTLKERPELVRRAVRAHIRAARLIQEDQEAAVACLIRRWGLSQRVAEGIWDYLRHHFIAEIDPALLKPEFKHFAQHLLERFPDKPLRIPDPSTVVDPSFFDVELQRTTGKS